MNINKSKISTVYNKNFTNTKLRKIPKKRAVYIPNNLPNDRSPRTIYDVSGLKRYLNSLHNNNPPSPSTRKPLSYPWYKKLYTKNEIEASKHTRSNRFKLINHMKTRKHLSSKQKVEYLNRLKNGESLKKIINNVNRTTIARNKYDNNFKYDDEIFRNIETNQNIFIRVPNIKDENLAKRFRGRRTINDKNILHLAKQVRILMYKQLSNYSKNNNFNDNYLPFIEKYQPVLQQLEDIILAVQYIDSESYFKNMKGIKDVRKHLYDIIKKYIFQPNGIYKIQLHVVHSFNKILFGSSVSDKNLYIRSINILKLIKSEGRVGRVNGFKLEEWLKSDYSNAVQNVKNTLENKNYNINYNFNRIEPFNEKTKKVLKMVIEKYHPRNKNMYMKKINKMKPQNHENILQMLPKNKIGK